MDSNFAGRVVPSLSLMLSSSGRNQDSQAKVASLGNPTALLDTINAGAPSSTSTAGAFLLSMHNSKSLEETDLPEFVKEHNATLSFPEKLMIMLTHVEKESSKNTTENKEEPCISWILNGRAFIIRNRDTLVKDVLPLFFKEGKFASFTRKLYRWGFRQVNVGPDRIQRREMIFGHDRFQRDNKQLMVGMRSVTAAGRRRAAAAQKREQENAALACPDGFEKQGVPVQQGSPSVAPVSAGSKRPASEELEQALKKKSGSLSQDPMMQISNPRLLQLGGLPGVQGFGPLYQQQGMLQAREQLASQYLSTLSQISMNNRMSGRGSGNSDQINLDQGQSQENSKRMHAAIDLLLRYS